MVAFGGPLAVLPIHLVGLNSAFNILGNNNQVQAGFLNGLTPAGGPFAIAGEIGTSNHDGVTLPVITQIAPGVNIKTALNP